MSFDATRDASLGNDGRTLLKRWEKNTVRESRKKMIDCRASRPAYAQNDYLKPNHGEPLNRNTLQRLAPEEANNYNPVPNMNNTRFHRGFNRRQQPQIGQDHERVALEQTREARRDALDQQRIATTVEMREKVNYNIFSGEGFGRESEFRSQGKRIINPSGQYSDIFNRHNRDAQLRMRQSENRYFEAPAPRPTEERATTLRREGYTQSQRESVIIGYPVDCQPRQIAPRGKLISVGTKDNFAHLRGAPTQPAFECAVDKTKSQIVFG